MSNLDLDKGMEKAKKWITITVLAFSAFSILVFMILVRQKPTSSTVTPLPTQSAPGYKLIVGANPMVNKSPRFLPPTNSVVVTNENQLRLLIEQAKKSHQK